MCKKLIKNSIKIIEEYNKATGSDNFYPFILFIGALVCLVVAAIYKSLHLSLLSIVMIISGIYGYFQPLLLFRFQWLRKFNGAFVFLGIPIVSFYVGISFCKVYFQENSESSLILYTIFAIVMSLLFGSIYLKDAVEHLRRIDENSLNVFYILLELYQVIHFFAIIYSVILIFDHSGFAGVNTSSAFSLYLDMFYFSTVTFTTLGYGDIVPINPIAKVTVILEVFLFVIVISLIVVNMSKHRRAKEESVEGDTSEEQIGDKPTS
ncbi:MAG: potassium channel family protein [Clostridiaceae bacterium]